MLRTMMHAKLHGARVTGHRLDYRGSITLDKDLIEAVGLLPNEQVDVVDKANGARFRTYVIEGERGSGSVCVNGAAARLVADGDELLVIAYAQLTDDEARDHRPKIAYLSPENRVVELGS